MKDYLDGIIFGFVFSALGVLVTEPTWRPILCQVHMEASSGMRHFIFTLQLEGKRFEDSISAADRFAAERIMRARYPGVVIWNIREE